MDVLKPKNGGADAGGPPGDSVLRALWYASGEGLVTLDAGGVIRAANPAAEAMLGSGKSEGLVGSRLDAIVPDLGTDPKGWPG